MACLAENCLVKRRRHFIYEIVLLLLLLFQWACLPASKVTIELGKEYQRTDLDKLDALIEDFGYRRLWLEGENNQRMRHLEYEGIVVSQFQCQCPKRIGISVSWQTDDGSLSVIFVERNVELSVEAKEMLQRLIERLRDIYGEAVKVQT
jgi:hypothetical protein